MSINHYMFSCFFAISSIAVNTFAREAIVNGKIVRSSEQFPYQVSLQLAGHGHFGSICGGGIIAEEFILTTAHCVVNITNTIIRAPFYILAGTNDLRQTNRPTVIRKVKMIFVPTDYNASQPNIPIADIAVLKLQEPLGLTQNNYLKALQLPRDERQSYRDRQAVISGYGWSWIKIVVTDDGEVEQGGNNDTLLRYAKVDVLYECKDKYWKTAFERTASKSKICARIHQRDTSKPQGVCTGDSGSPLVHNGIVIGILSTSAKGCQEIGQAGYYSRVAYHLTFIKLAMNNKYHKDLRLIQLHY